MHFLTFDTSLDKTYITLFNKDKSIDTQVIETHDDKYHSAFLIQNLVTMLKSHSLVMKDIGAIGVNIGPGSFTGIRACLTIARVITQQLEIPLIGVSSMEILAKLNTTQKISTVIMDARKEMCYFAQYDSNGNELIAPQLKEIDELNINTENETIITDTTMQNILNKKSIECICYTEKNNNLGLFLGQITYKKLQSQNDLHWAKVKPLYLQKPSITVSKKSIL